MAAGGGFAVRSSLAAVTGTTWVGSSLRLGLEPEVSREGKINVNQE